MRKLLIFFTLLTLFKAAAQPGYRTLQLPSGANEARRSYNHYYIDSGTDVSKLKNLRFLRSLNIVVRIKVLPKEFYFLSDSLKEITIDGSDKLADITSLGQLKNLESVRITNYAGSDLPDLGSLKKLKSFSIEKYYGGDNLKHISGLSDCKSLTKLYIRSGAIEKLDLDMGRMNLKELEVSRCTSIKDLTAISRSRTLKKLRLWDCPLKELPGDMQNMTSLEDVDLSEVQFINIDALKEMKNLRRLNIDGGFSLTQIPASFSTNLKIETVSVSYSRELRSAEGIAGLKNLKSFHIADVNPAFLIPSKINTCSNLEEISISINIASKQKDISMIRDFLNLKKLSLLFCPFSVIPPSFFTNKNIEELAIVGNKLVTDLSSLAKFEKLRKLEIALNDKLTNIPDLNKAMSLVQDLHIWQNKKLILPDDNGKSRTGWIFKDNGNK